MIVALVACALAVPAGADPGPPLSTWIPDGEVKSVAVSGSTAYIGGNFTRIAPYTGSAALFDSTTAEARRPWPEVNGVVNAVVSDGSGGWYLGGDFIAVAGVPRQDLAHVLADGTLDQSWAPTTNGEVRALTVSAPGPGSFVVAGGNFSTANGVARGDLAAFDGSSGALTSFNGSVSASALIDPAGVYALVLGGTALSPVVYVSGEFDLATGSNTSLTRNRMAAFVVGTSELVAGFDVNTNRLVNSLALNGSTLFIGGRFTKANGATDRFGMAEVSASTGVLTSWVAPAQCCNDLTAMTLSGSKLFVTGTIYLSPTITRHAAAFDAPTASVYPFNPPVAGTPRSIAVSGSNVYIGSGANFPAGPTLAAYDSTTGAPTGWAPALGRGSQFLPSGSVQNVFAIAVSGSDVVAGGTFESAGGVARRNLAAIDLATGQPTGFNPPMEGAFANFASVNAVALSDGLVWAGGTFETTGPDNRSGLAAFDAATGAQASFDNDPNGEVLALAASGSTVYVGGSFSALGSTQRRNIAAVQHVPGTAGTVLPFDGDADGGVRALAATPGVVYLGGSFTTLNGSLASHLAPRRNLAAVDPTSGDALPWDPDADGPVDALAVGGGTVFAGGEFANVNHTTARQRLAAFDPQDGSARAWAPAADARVRALAVNGPSVFAGGDFTSITGVARSGLAELDSQAGGVSGWNPVLLSDDRNGGGYTRTNPLVNALGATQQAGLVAGGDFLMNGPLFRGVNFAAFPLPPLVADSSTPGATPGPDVVNPGAAADRTKPVLVSFTATRKRFRAGPRATPLNGTAAAKKKKAPRGTTLALRLSEPASVKFEVLLKGKGRRVGKKCVKPTPKNRKRKACTLLTRKGAFTRSARSGRSKVAFSARFKRPLKPGAYVVRATPTDAAGNVGKPRTLSITVVR